MCDKCNGNCNSCNCTCSSPCSIPDCACEVFLTTDCITLQEDLVCSNILKGQTETEVLKQLDAYICARFETVENFVQLVNVGGGAGVYKGISVTGKKELKSLISSDDSVTITEGTNEIDLTVPNVVIQPVSATEEGIVTNTELQELGGVDKLINGVRVGQGNYTDTGESLNTVLGVNALSSNTEGYTNVAIGYNSLKNNTIGGQNIAVNYGALENNTEGWANVAIGVVALNKNTTGSYNVAIGLESMWQNTTGEYNTAIGEASLEDNTTGSFNVAVGNSALGNNTIGGYNTALGGRSLYRNTTGNYNVAVGEGALNSQTGSNNTVVGYGASGVSTTSSDNTVVGYRALQSNTTGSGNIAIGTGAGSEIASTANNSTSSNGIFIGNNTKPSLNGGTNEIIIGSTATGSGSNTVTIGNDSILSTVLKGLVTAPLTTNALITAGTGKTLITREYLEAYGGGGAEVDPTAIHKTGNESGLTGIKEWTNSTGAFNAGLHLINNSNASQSILLENNSTSASIIGTNTVSNGSIIRLDNTASSGVAAVITNSNTVSGEALRVISNSSGGVALSLASSGAGGSHVGFGVESDGGIGQSIFMSNGIYALSILYGSASEGINLNATSTSTNTYSIKSSNNNVLNFTLDKLGNLTGNSFVKTGGTSSEYLMADGSTSTAVGDPTLRMIISQTGTSNPTYTISKNTTGGTIVSFIRNSAGGYTLTTSFTIPVTAHFVIQPTLGNLVISIERNTSTSLKFTTVNTASGSPFDGVLESCPFELII